jgi:hypothetical protein
MRNVASIAAAKQHATILVERALGFAGIDAHVEEHRTHYTAAGFGNCSRVERENYTTDPQAAEIARAIQDFASVACSPSESELEPRIWWEDIDALLVDVVRLHLAPRTDVGLAALALVEAHEQDKAWTLIVEAMPNEWNWRVRQSRSHWLNRYRHGRCREVSPNQLTLALGGQV